MADDSQPNPTDPPASTSEHRLTWQIALLGAGSALLGGIIGVFGSIWVAERGFDNDREAARQEQRELAYSGFLTAVTREKSALRRVLFETTPPTRKELERGPVGDPAEQAEQLRESLEASLAASQRLTRLTDDDDRALSDVAIYGSESLLTEAFKLTDVIEDARSSVSIAVVLDDPKTRQDAIEDIGDLEVAITTFALNVRLDLEGQPLLDPLD